MALREEMGLNDPLVKRYARTNNKQKIYNVVGGGNMERLMQKYIKYFYVTLLIIILVQFVGITIETILSGFQCGTIISLMLFLINVILLIDAIKHNVRQQFTECKEDARILRFTLALLAIFRMLSCSCNGFDWIQFTI